VSAGAIDLTRATSDAFEAYQAAARDTFVARVIADVPSFRDRVGVIFARPGHQDGIISIVNGLVHHWVGAAFIPNLSVQQALEVSSTYESYSRWYTGVLRSQVLERDGDVQRVLMRIREGEAGVTAVLDVRSTVRYYVPARDLAYVLSITDEIREVRNAGGPDERLLPVGQDSGYLWRAATFTSFRAHGDGLYVEMETLGLSRRFPSMLGWLIEPIARRLGRKSVERTLTEFVAALQRR
jgi:hypothetical protein